MITKQKTQCQRQAIDGEHFCAQHGIIYLQFPHMTKSEMKRWWSTHTIVRWWKQLYQ